MDSINHFSVLYLVKADGMHAVKVKPTKYVKARRGTGVAPPRTTGYISRLL